MIPSVDSEPLRACSSAAGASTSPPTKAAIDAVLQLLPAPIDLPPPVEASSVECEPREQALLGCLRN